MKNVESLLKTSRILLKIAREFFLKEQFNGEKEEHKANKS